MPERPPGGTAAQTQRAIPDDPGAEQRRRLLVVEAVRQPVGVRLVDQTGVGVAAVDVPAGERRGQAEVLLAAAAESAAAVGAAEPGDPDPVADGEPFGAGAERVDHADHLVPGGHLRPGAAADRPRPDAGRSGTRRSS